MIAGFATRLKYACGGLMELCRIVTGNGCTGQTRSAPLSGGAIRSHSPTLDDGFDQTALTRHTRINPSVTPALQSRGRFSFQGWRSSEMRIGESRVGTFSCRTLTRQPRGPIQD